MDALTPQNYWFNPKTIDLTPLIPVLRALSLCIMGTLSMPYGHFSKYLKLKLKMMSYHALKSIKLKMHNSKKINQRK